MTSKEYQKIIDNVPKYEAIFSVIRVPISAKQYGVKVGDRNDTPIGFNGCAIQPSYLKFEGYRQYVKVI
jgi:hypothetical protein